MKKRHAPLLLLLAASLWRCSNGNGDLPEPYRSLPVPAHLLENVEARLRGRGLYLQHCALCHGENADGNGVRRHGLSSQPQDYNDPVWRNRVTPRQVFFTVREGKRGTSMPAWKNLNEVETWDVVAYVLSVAENGP